MDGKIATNKKSLISSALLVLTALVWGVGFVAQSAGSKVVEPFTFSTVRFFISSAAVSMPKSRMKYCNLEKRIFATMCPTWEYYKMQSKTRRKSLLPCFREWVLRILT